MEPYQKVNDIDYVIPTAKKMAKEIVLADVSFVFSEAILILLNVLDMFTLLVKYLLGGIEA